MERLPGPGGTFFLLGQGLVGEVGGRKGRAVNPACEHSGEGGETEGTERDELLARISSNTFGLNKSAHADPDERGDTHVLSRSTHMRAGRPAPPGGHAPEANKAGAS